MLPAASACRSIWFSSVTPAIFLGPSALQFNRVCGEIRPRYSPRQPVGAVDERVADTSMESHQAANTRQRRGGCAELQGRRGRRRDPAQGRQCDRCRRRHRHGHRHARAVDERHRRRRLHDDLERQGGPRLDDRLRSDLGHEARSQELPHRRPRPRQSLRLARHPRAEERGRLSLDRRARPGRRHGQGAGALRHAEVEGRHGAGRRARQARHGARLVHAGDDRQRRAAPRQVPGLQGQPTCRDDGRVPDARLAGQRALPQARQSRRDLSAAERRRPARVLRGRAWRATSPPTCRPAARRSTTTTSAPTRRASSSRCRSSMAAPPSMSRAASPPARRCGARVELAGAGTKGKGAPGRRLLRRHRRRACTRPTRSGSRPWATSPPTPAPRISAPPIRKATWWR